jgi:hypothetical protein
LLHDLSIRQAAEVEAEAAGKKKPDAPAPKKKTTKEDDDLAKLLNEGLSVGKKK